MRRNRGQRKAAAIIGLAAVLGMTGCAGNEEEPERGQEDILIQDELQEEAGEPEEGNEKEEAGGSESEAFEQDEAGGDTEESGGENASNSMAAQEKDANHEELAGNVRSVSQDSFVISKEETWSEGDADFAVGAAPGYEEEEDLITVYAAENCAYQYKTVKNGGVNPEDITVREGRFADLQENIAVILKGNWRSDGAFLADTIEMMIFV